MANDPPSTEPERRENTVRVVRTGDMMALSEDPVDRYQYHFAHLIEARVEAGEQPVTALDLTGGNGFSTLTLWPRLPEGSRVVALADDRGKLKTFHQQLTGDLRRVIYPRKERRDRLPFAVGAFDLVWASLATDTLNPLRPCIRQALRVLRTHGQLIVAAPLRETFVELAAGIGAALEQSGQADAFRSLMAIPPELLDLDGWKKTLERCGAVDVGSHRDAIEITVTPPMSRQRLFTEYLLPMWIGNDPTVQAKALRLLDEFLRDEVTVTAHIGCLWAKRGEAELTEATLSG